MKNSIIAILNFTYNFVQPYYVFYFIYLINYVGLDTFYNDISLVYIVTLYAKSYIWEYKILVSCRWQIRFTNY